MGYSVLTSEPLDIEDLTARVRSNKNGAYVTFVGDVRDHDSGKRVKALEYTAYNPLAVKRFAELIAEAEDKWPVECALAHRIGPVGIGEASVIVVVGSAHRGDAFDACRWIIDTLKTTAPIWKRETYEDGSQYWIEGDKQVSAETGDQR